jgi:hypothetical protein
MADTKAYVKQYESWADSTNEDRPLIERDRDYVDHKQWTSNEAAVLKSRGQAAVVMNRIKPKVEFMKGMEAQARTDPKAFARTPQHEDDSEAITDALRFVGDNTDFDQTASQCFDEYIVEGTEAAIVDVDKNPRGEYEINIRQINWDRFYYDNHSRRLDFSDAAYMGITTWLYVEEAKKMFPGVAEDIESLAKSVAVETHEDRPKWRDKKNNRVRVNEHYFKKDGIWNLVYFTEGLELRPVKESPFKDEFGEPACPIVAQSAYIGRENDRYGAIRGLINPQDEINHRRSKALHMLSNVRVIGDPGVVASTTRAMNQLKSGSAWIEKQTEGSIEILDNNDFAQGQLALLQEAKGEIDAQGVNAALGGDGQASSGREVEARQAGGSVELTPLLDGHRAWKRRIYRAVWYRVKQFWDEEKWVRVTDDENNMKFVGLNRPVTQREQIAEQLGIAPEQVEAALQEQGIGVMPGSLDEVVETRAQVSELDMDIILAESPDVVNIRQEQFAEIVNLAQVYGPEFVPFDVILELSSLRNKDQMIERLRGEGPEAQQQMEMQQAQMAAEQEDKQVEQAVKLSTARKNNAAADQTQIETQLAIQGLEKIG